MISVSYPAAVCAFPDGAENMRKARGTPCRSSSTWLSNLNYIFSLVPPPMLCDVLVAYPKRSVQRDLWVMSISPRHLFHLSCHNADLKSFSLRRPCCVMEDSAGKCLIELGRLGIQSFIDVYVRLFCCFYTVHAAELSVQWSWVLSLQ